jgi:hypothetical protein
MPTPAAATPTPLRRWCASGYQDAVVHNYEGGLMLAGAYGDNAVATGLWLGAAYDAYLLNEGTIAAKGDGERIAIDATNVLGGTTIINSGVVSGDILLGDGDDYLYNEVGGRAAARGRGDRPGRGMPATATCSSIPVWCACSATADIYLAAAPPRWCPPSTRCRSTTTA